MALGRGRDPRQTLTPGSRGPVQGTLATAFVDSWPPAPADRRLDVAASQIRGRGAVALVRLSLQAAELKLPRGGYLILGRLGDTIR